MWTSGFSGYKPVFRYICIFFYLLADVPSGNCQLFPGLTGEALEDAIRNEYTPAVLLNDNQVRDTLYGVVFNQQDSVHCIYSGYAKFLPSGVDPSQWLYGNGTEVGSMNLEHSWPQSKGAGDGTMGNMNMYHLYPSRTAINSDRGDFPFGEINDAQTQRWYLRDKEMATKPSSNLDAYSEYINGHFEPRESVKGDLARGMFYFWTIYRNDALAADPLFFDSMLDDLCLWHQQDPVDAFELLRNSRIAAYQDGKENPFIIDCSLVMRAYCNQLPECQSVSAHDFEDSRFKIFYNPTDDRFVIEGDEDIMWRFMIVDELGHSINTQYIRTNQSADPVQLIPGIYFAFAVTKDKVINSRFFVP